MPSSELNQSSPYITPLEGVYIAAERIILSLDGSSEFHNAERASFTLLVDIMTASVNDPSIFYKAQVLSSQEGNTKLGFPVATHPDKRLAVTLRDGD